MVHFGDASRHSATALYGLLFCRLRVYSVQNRTVSRVKNEPRSFLVHLTGGILRHFQAFSTPRQNPALEVLSHPAHPQVTQTVETVEKVSFQKLFLKSGRKTLKSALFIVFRATFWRFSSLLWEIFVNIFQARSFSTVSLGA